MRISALVVALLIVSSIVFAKAQPPHIKWAKGGNAFYEVEDGAIVRVDLPSFNKKTMEGEMSGNKTKGLH